MIFANRREAGRALGRALEHLRGEHPLVLALPRGGVPVGYEVAMMLEADFDLLLVRKLGAPGFEEVGIGAVVDGDNPQIVLNEDILRMLSLPTGHLERETQRQYVELERRRSEYLGGRNPVQVEGRTVIVVDDGIATGGTMRAALQGIRRKKPNKLVLAVPVASADTIPVLRPECNEIVCLATPDPFYAVGHYYADFAQTSDEEVKQLLDSAHRATSTTTV